MKKHIKNLALLLGIITVAFIGYNKLISVFNKMNDSLPTDKGTYYKWKYGDIFYTKTGKGEPVILLHDLAAEYSGYEWHRVVKKLSRTNTVYTLDLIGCGRSDKPNLTYTNYLYVQLLNAFIRDVVKKPASVIASGKSVTYTIMACNMEPTLYNKLIGVNPADIYEMMKMPSKKRNIVKFLIDLPVVGTFIYNIEETHHKIADRVIRDGFFKPHMIPKDLIKTLYYGAHTADNTGKYLFASIKSRYINVNVVPALKNVNHSICLIGGKEDPLSCEIIADYKEYNAAVEEAYISDTCCLPHLESPEKFNQLVQILLNS